ncbi:MAG: ice-binding family protein, partial [Coriobacteriia bacterium]
PITSTQPVDLGGLTLGPGVYDTGGVISITGTLTLDAQGDPDAVFIFKSTATLITASASRVQLINGARFCRVFWVVPSSATLGTDSTFVGHIFALTDIHAQTGAEVEGQLLARNGEVTLDTNVITNEICAPARIIHVTKTASPSSLPAGPGSVRYTYLVTNPGTVELSDVTVTDNKISAVTYASGDGNSDGILQPGETWTYTAIARLSATTTNVVTATGIGAGIATTDTASATVAVGTGALLPATATPWYGILLAGIALALLGAVSYTRNVIRG